MLSRWLVDAVRRKRKRIIITMPPRHGKSELTSVWFPAWYLELFQDHRVMLASYEADFAASWGRRVRNILQEHESELDVRVAKDSSAADRWETTEGGGMMTAGVDGAFTGKGANCLVAGTLVETNVGPIRIEDLNVGTSSVKLLTLNSTNGALEFKKAEAVAHRTSTRILRITTASGRMVEATEDHPFFSRGSYVPAGTLAPGDPLLCVVPRRVCEAGLRSKPRDAVRRLPPPLACGQGFETIEDTVAMVERVRGEGAGVYDIQVADNHNFFANGILTHNCLLIDDPIKNAEKANSALEREKVWNFYRSTAYTRLEPDGIVILIQTRWHSDDLAGRLIDHDRQADLLDGEVETEQFDVLNLPAIAEDLDLLGRRPGQALWPERYNEQRLAEIRHTLGTYFWSALYQQHPVPPDGGGLMFRAEWFPILDEEPPGYRWLRWWDRAATDPDPIKKNDPDWTVGVKLGLGPQRQLCVGDAVRMRGSPGAVKAKMLETAQRDGTGVFVCGAQDPASAGLSEVHSLKQLLKGYRCDFFPETGDKVVRAGLISAESEPKVGEKYGNVSVVKGAWNDAFFEVLRKFPTKGEHDDDVDALSGAYSVILQKFPRPAFAGASAVGSRASGRG